MKYKKNYCILLTACVNPSGMSHTVLQDASVRAKQYKNALDFYLQNTNTPIIFCENTNYDISQEYIHFIITGRLEVLTFDGNNYDKGRGKGYGEALIMKYALDNSEIIRQCKYIIKITGRIIVKDINRISESLLYIHDNIFRSNIKDKFISTYIFIARPYLVQRFVEKYMEKIWEDRPTNDLIEFLFYRALTTDSDFDRCIYLPFFRIPEIKGISGTTGEPYTMNDRLIGNVIYTYYLEMDRNNKLIAFPYLIFYYILLCIDKLKVKLGIKERSYF